MESKYKLVRAQLKRLHESVERLESYTCLQLDHKAILDELQFTSNIVNAMRKNVKNDQQITGEENAR